MLKILHNWYNPYLGSGNFLTGMVVKTVQFLHRGNTLPIPPRLMSKGYVEKKSIPSPNQCSMTGVKKPTQAYHILQVSNTCKCFSVD